MSQNIPEQFFEKLRNESQTQYDYLQFREWLNTASDPELEEVLDKYSWYFENEADQLTVEDDQLINRIEGALDQIDSQKPDKGKHPFWYFKRLAGVAAILSAIAFSYLLLKPKQVSQTSYTVQKTRSTYKIVPGGNKAVLTLGNGSNIILDSAKNGLLASQSNVRIIKAKNGQLIYDASGYNDKQDAKLSFNTVTVPRGGQYQVVLPDGSKVWLNAASSLRYPAQFRGPERLVELTGEAYFEVAKDRQHPFKISVNNTQVEVLGTHFNIMGYKDEPVSKTTLLEGSVRITKGTQTQMIVPGQQAIVSENIIVARVNVAEAVEWKNGNFNFAHEKLETIMRKISRWYDVDIAYEGKTSSATFVGTLPRSKNITDVLKYLELTGLVHFNIKERSVTAMP